MELNSNLPKQPWFLGLDIGGSSIKVLASHGHGIEILSGSIGTGSRIFEDVLTDCMSLIQSWAPKFQSLPSAIGIGFPGIISDDGIVIGAPNLPHWVNLNLKKIFHQLFNCPVGVENDANCAALSEADYLRLNQGYRKVVMLTLGTGVGAGIIWDGQIFRGAKGFAGEAGHLCVEPNGFECGCGRKGCLEQYFSAKGIPKVARDEFHFLGEISVKTFFRIAHDSSTLERKVLDRCCDALAIGISNICALIDPDCIVLGGGISKDGDFLLDLLEPKLRQRVRYPGYHLPDLRISHFHDKAGGVGCLLLAEQVYTILE